MTALLAFLVLLLLVVVAPRAWGEAPFVTPTGATGARLCVFPANPDPASARPSSCRDTHRASDLQAIVQELDALAPAPRGRGTCVRDSNAGVRLVLAYRDGHRERVDVHFSGCQFAEHTGRISRQSTHAVRSDLSRRAGGSSSTP